MQLLPAFLEASKARWRAAINSCRESFHQCAHVSVIVCVPILARRSLLNIAFAWPPEICWLQNGGREPKTVADTAACLEGKLAAEGVEGTSL